MNGAGTREPVNAGCETASGRGELSFVRVVKPSFSWKVFPQGFGLQSGRKELLGFLRPFPWRRAGAGESTVRPSPGAGGSVLGSG